ncbi:MAG TPA: hypothetical protein VHZ74_04710 [Bryobacteraceae bacterium]|jgi:hypothetical protein|nr:hypothetical protein [Bryobacteraceae bacterium]
MPTGLSKSPKLLKGALIEFSASVLAPTPNLIVFQYNPETLSRSLTPWAPSSKEDKEYPDDKLLNVLSQPYDPQETLTLQLELDAADSLEDPASHPASVITGIADRIAALEILLYGQAKTLSGALKTSVEASLSAAAGKSVTVVDQVSVPVLLFCWGPGRIVPVRIQSFSVDEQAFLPTLYPIRAKVTIGLKILDKSAFDVHDDSPETKIAKAAYDFTLAQKRALAIASTVSDAVSTLPF